MKSKKCKAIVEIALPYGNCLLRFSFIFRLYLEEHRELLGNSLIEVHIEYVNFPSVIIIGDTSSYERINGNLKGSKVYLTVT